MRLEVERGIEAEVFRISPALSMNDAFKILGGTFLHW